MMVFCNPRRCSSPPTPPPASCPGWWRGDTTTPRRASCCVAPSRAGLGQRDSDGSGRHSCKCNYADTVWVCPAPMLTQFECARRPCLHCSLSLSEPGPYADTVCVKPGPPCWHKFKVETMKQSKISSFSNKTVTMGYEQRQPTFPPTQI